MKIVDLKKEHLVKAEELIRLCYQEESAYVDALPTCVDDFHLSSFAENDFSAAAFERDELVGVLCSYPPFENAFGSTCVKGIFSPMGANAAVKDNREKIYAAMYQTVAQKWVNAGALSHAICLYAHDEPLQREFYRLGFGLRCLDAIRKMEEIKAPSLEGYTFMELPEGDSGKIYPLFSLLNLHYEKSPFFMNREKQSKDDFLKFIQDESTRFFVAFAHGEICAYYEVANSGETCICDDEKYLHICGAYCLPEHRGKGVAQNLLNYMINTLKTEGYTRIGVDFESINPTAYGFWMKYFTPYTHSVVRRIDENGKNF